MKVGFVMIVLAAAPGLADEVHLRGGGRITGEIVGRTADAVTVDVGGGTMTVRMSSIVRIDEGTSTLQEYRARAAEVPPGDAEAWRELARWAQSRTLSSQAAEAYAQVVAILPDDDEANRALGRVRLGGVWVDESESYRAQGYVEFEGEWMTPEERQAILSDRRAREQADRQAIDAEIQAIEAEQQAERQRQEAERERKRREISWGWGAGPRYWPQPGVTVWR